MATYADGIGYGRPAANPPTSVPEDHRNRFGILEVLFDFDEVVRARAARDGVPALAVGDKIDLYRFPGPSLILGTSAYVERAATNSGNATFDLGTAADEDVYVDGANAKTAGGVTLQSGAAAQSIVGNNTGPVRLTLLGNLPTSLQIRVATAFVLLRNPYVRKETYG